ncbi:hypothetical protein PVL29_009165 [Vitis rotundifolia]|uniref:MADS-box domain-containing protein n=1 Tax=Vitis rotundifolia TaxID=103349 RepID=A0AA39DV44_VITRO|nr:hypothetical protein PVL29_009165 [Vitis rotundifolia]
MGRQKIQIKKIEKKNSLEVTFSKCRTGLFKKAGELCILCGAEAAVIVFSPGRRAFVFGHPSADAIIDRFLHRETNSRALVPAGQVHGYVQRQYLEALGRLEVKREQEETVGGDEEGGFWWDAPIENMGLNELEQFRGFLEKLRKKVADRVEEMTMIMMMESVMVEYAAPPQEYNSSGVLHGYDLAAHGIPHGFDFGFGFDGHLF